MKARSLQTPSPPPAGNMRRMALAAITVFAVVAWWSHSLEEPSGAHDPAVAGGRQPEAASRGGWPVIETVRRMVPAEATTSEATPAGDAAFGKYVAGKYRFLDENSAQLHAALIEREKIVVAINTAKQGTDEAARADLPVRVAELAARDREIGALLPAADLAAFEAIKDSDIERFQLEDYAGGITNIAPLSDTAKQAILYSKLAHRQRFRQVLADSGLARGDLGTADRQFVLAELGHALEESRDGFLAEARQYLHDEDQYALLSNYENSEFTAELAKLRAMAEGK